MARVLLQHVLLVLLQPALHVVTVLHALEVVMVVVVHAPLRVIQERTRPLLQQEEHQLSERTLELATDGQELKPEARHRVMSTMLAAPLHVQITLDVPLEHVAHVEPGHGLGVRTLIPATARLAVTLTLS